MAEFTLLKLQFDDASFSASAPFSGSEESAVEVETDEEDEESGSLGALLLGLVFLVVVAVAVKKYLGSGEDLPVEE